MAGSGEEGVFGPLEMAQTAQIAHMAQSQAQELEVKSKWKQEAEQESEERA